MKFSNIFKTSDQFGSLGDEFRKKRFSFFENKLKTIDKPVTILDIGGLESFWVNRNFANREGYTITILNLTSFSIHSDNIRSIVGDAVCLKDIKDNEYDIVFSNSVIEHLYTKTNQISMAEEVKRVGKYYFIQTPNKYFPIEPHYVLPFFQFLPNRLKYFILTKTKLSRLHKWEEEYAKQYLEEIRLISYQEMKEFFPEGEIYCERVAGLVKSFTAHNFA